MSTIEVKYAWYSSNAADQYGHAIWRTVGGKEIVVTLISEEAPSPDIKPGVRNDPQEVYKWNDTVYQGQVVEFVRSFFKNEPR